MTFGNYEIVKDGETAALTLVGKNKKTGDKTLRPVAYARDLLEVLQALERKMSVEAFDKEPNAKKLIALLEKQHEDLIHLVKKGCRECLK